MANENIDRIVRRHTEFEDIQTLCGCVRLSQHPMILDMAEDRPREKVILAQHVKDKTGVVCNLINQPLNGSLCTTIKLLGLTSTDHKRFLAKAKARGVK